MERSKKNVWEEKIEENKLGDWQKLWYEIKHSFSWFSVYKKWIFSKENI